jgi:hypothetical protein
VAVVHRHLLILSVVLAAHASPARAQKAFEGTITYAIDMGERQMQLAISTRGSRVRQEMTMSGTPIFSEGTYQIFDFRTGDVTTVVPGMKRYMVVNRRAARAERDSARDRLLASVTATGRKETIAGLDCEVYVVQDRPGDEWCITSELGHFLGFDGPASVARSGGGVSLPENSALSRLMRTFKRGAALLRMRVTGPDGRDLTMTATKIDRTVRPKGDFEVPAGFAEMQDPTASRP